jgi:hypothetical protein
LTAVKLRQRAGVYRSVRTGCVTSADGSLTMIMLSASLKGCARWHLSARDLGVLIGRPLGYEVNGPVPCLS